ncbi:MAG: relaxase domain-containing protein [Actinomycetota bacterium]|nr:relaxase domain-containing protein [Actinomycetota bacterium]
MNTCWASTIDEFSQRRDEIEEMLAESGYTSARARQKATLATRRPKEREVDPDALATAWRKRSAALGFDDLPRGTGAATSR